MVEGPDRRFFEESLADDRELFAQIEANRNKRRTGGRMAALFLALLLGGASVALFAVGGERAGVDSPKVGEGTLPPGGEELSALIDGLEGRLRKPGRAQDYRLLAEVYRLRYEERGEAADLNRSREALGRAEALERKREVTMQGKPWLFAGLFLVVGCAAAGIVVMLLYNSLASRDESVDARWSQVEAVMQRRLDLIPNLVETVRGYADHESETLMAVTEARAKALSALGGGGAKAPVDQAALREIQSAQQGLGSALTRLLAVVENYPDLKASRNFLGLQDQLEGTENRIAVERMRYNESVRDLNARLRLFPFNVVGSLFGFAPRAYFESDRNAEKTVDVSF